MVSRKLLLRVAPLIRSTFAIICTLFLGPFTETVVAREGLKPLHTHTHERFFILRLFFMNEYVLANLAPPKSKIFPVGPNHLTPFRYCIFMSLKTCVPPPHFLSYRDPCSVGNLDKSKDNKDKTFAKSETIIPIPRQSLVLTGDGSYC